jgi:hypothetical protein
MSTAHTSCYECTCNVCVCVCVCACVRVHVCVLRRYRYTSHSRPVLPPVGVALNFLPPFFLPMELEKRMASSSFALDLALCDLLLGAVTVTIVSFLGSSGVRLAISSGGIRSVSVRGPRNTSGVLPAGKSGSNKPCHVAPFLCRLLWLDKFDQNIPIECANARKIKSASAGGII